MRSQRLHQWFNNHTRVSSKASNGRQNLLNLAVKESKRLQLSQAYTRLYWNEKLKKIVDERWEEHKLEIQDEDANAATKLPAKAPIAFRNAIVRALLNEESSEVIEKVKRFRDESKGVPRNNDGEDGEGQEMGTEEDEEAKRVARAQRYHK